MIELDEDGAGERHRLDLVGDALRAALAVALYQRGVTHSPTVRVYGVTREARVTVGAHNYVTQIRQQTSPHDIVKRAEAIAEAESEVRNRR